MKRGSSSKFLIGKQKIQPPKKKTHYLRGRKFKSMILFGVFIKSYYKNFSAPRTGGRINSEGFTNHSQALHPYSLQALETSQP